MNLYHWLILACWLLFLAFWFVMAFSAKKNVGGSRWRQQLALRAILVIVAVLALRTRHLRPFALRAYTHFYITDPGLGAVGALLCAAGVGLAIWARIYLGRNWGMPMSRKQDPELVTGGPYAYVRHPIYTGVMLAMLGSAVGESLFWLLPLTVASAYFIYSARTEERLMLQQFPQQYPAYMKRTKMLLPFIF